METIWENCQNPCKSILNQDTEKHLWKIIHKYKQWDFGYWLHMKGERESHIEVGHGEMVTLLMEIGNKGMVGVEGNI